MKESNLAEISDDIDNETTSAIEEHPIIAGWKFHHLRYADNLLSCNPFSDELIKFILSCFGIASRMQLIESLTGMEANQAISGQNNLMVSFQDVKNITDTLVNRLGIEDPTKAYKFVEIVKKHLKYESNSYESMAHHDFDNRLNELYEIFRLNTVQIGILAFIFCLYYTNNNWLKALSNGIKYPEFVLLVARATGRPLSMVNQCFSIKGSLVCCGLMEIVNEPGDKFVTINESVVNYLSGVIETTLSDRYTLCINDPVVDLDIFSVSKARMNIIRKMLLSPDAVHILFYGTESAEITEFARAISVSVGKNVFYHNNENLSFSEERLAFCTTIHRAAQNNGIVIIKDARFLLEYYNILPIAESVLKKTEEYVLYNMSNPHIIWIMGDVDNLAENIQRHFSYTLYLNAWSVIEREKYWRKSFENSTLKSIISATKIKKLANDYKLNPTYIVSTIHSVEALYSSGKFSRKEVLPALREILSSRQKFDTGNTNQNDQSLLNLITEKYDVSALNIDADNSVVLRAVMHFANSIKGRTSEIQGCLNILLHGMPGTGKTEFVKYLARESGLELIIKRYSDLSSKWTGETESKIAQSFKDAFGNKAILFIDEADSFFFSREMAIHSWEVTCVNELLTQMENHKGIFVCCTNHMPNIDGAAMRRFSYKIEFKSLSAESKVCLFRQYFNQQGNTLTNDDENRIMGIPNLTPGDYKTVAQRLQFIEMKESPVNRIITELEKEVAYKQQSRTRRIGFM